MKEPLRLRLEGAVWLAGWQLSRILPERWVRAGFERLSERDHRRNEKRRAIVRANLEPAVPSERLDAVVREAFLWYGRYWAETFRMPDITPEAFDRRFSIEGEEYVEAAATSGRGAVFATLHQGNWDAGGRWAASRWNLAVVVEVLRPRALFERFVEHRRTLGMTIIPLERGADATARCLEELSRGRLVALVADRDLTGRGIEVSMFGRTAKLPRGPASLALRAGVPLIPATIFQRADGSWHARVLPPIDATGSADGPEAVRALTQRLAGAFESFIAEEPAQWHMFTPYWVTS